MTQQQTTSITKSVSSLSGNIQIQPLSPPKPILPKKLTKVIFFNFFFLSIIDLGIQLQLCILCQIHRMREIIRKTQLF